MSSSSSSTSSTSFGELVLVLGDLHIPDRATKIPPAFQRMLVPNKMQHVICTGNVLSSPDVWHELSLLAPSFHCVMGDCDYLNENASIGFGSTNSMEFNPNSTVSVASTVFPETRVIQIGQFRIGVVHGHQLLPWGSKDAIDRMRRKLRVDILITGHTHQSAVVVDDENGFYHINPVRVLFS
jgi:vacuolar protein sorting-associated protein 29